MLYPVLPLARRDDAEILGFIIGLNEELNPVGVPPDSGGPCCGLINLRFIVRLSRWYQPVFAGIGRNSGDDNEFPVMGGYQHLSDTTHQFVIHLFGGFAKTLTKTAGLNAWWWHLLAHTSGSDYRSPRPCW